MAKKSYTRQRLAIIKRKTSGLEDISEEPSQFSENVVISFHTKTSKYNVCSICVKDDKASFIQFETLYISKASNLDVEEFGSVLVQATAFVNMLNQQVAK